MRARGGRSVRGFVAAAIAGAAWLAAPSLAHAQGTTIGVQGATSDAVVLKDGSVIRGRVTEVREGSHVLVQLDGGQVARVRWDVVARIDRAGAASQTPGTTTPPPAAAPIAAAPGALVETITVHIEAPEPVRLEVMAGRVGRFVCDSPCDIAVPIHGQYRIAGHMRSSKVFSMPGHHGDRVVLYVDPASSGGFVGGIVLVSLGGVSIVTGAFTYLIASLIYTATDGRDGKGGKTVGLVMLGGGAAAIAGGVVLLVLNGSTKVDEQITPPGAPAAAPPPQAWRTFEAPERSTAIATPPAFVTPVTFHF